MGGTCPTGPQAMFEITIKAEDGPVPPSTTVDVSWSAGDEPTFALDDPSTWKTIEQANLVCDVDPAKPPPSDLAALVCHMWTTSPINLVVKAQGYTLFRKDLRADPQRPLRRAGPVGDRRGDHAGSAGGRRR